MIMVMVMNSNMNAVGRKSGEDDIYSQENLQYLGLGFGSKDNDYFQRHLRDAFKKKKVHMEGNCPNLSLPPHPLQK